MPFVDQVVKTADFYTPSQAAVALGVSERTLDRMVGRGEVVRRHALDRALYLRREVDALAQRRQRAVTPPAYSRKVRKPK